MGYVEAVSRNLTPRSVGGPLVLDLFAGCGGLALGFEAQGFATHGFEMDADCCATYGRNLQGECTQVVLTWETRLPQARVVVGGPPCQPFSVGGKQLGLRDARDGFPIFRAAIERVRPDIWVMENVRGLFYRNRAYLDRMVRDLGSLGYVVDVRLLNAVHYEVPQRRERVIVVGHKGHFVFPAAVPKVVSSGEALGELAGATPPESKFLTASMDAYIGRYEKASACRRPRDLDLRKPARTLTTRNLAGATGDMQRIRLLDGRRRRLVVREAARLQSFPDWFEFMGSENSQYYQIGNAVPPMLAYHLASAVRSYLQESGGVTLAAVEGAMEGRQFCLL